MLYYQRGTAASLELLRLQLLQMQYIFEHFKFAILSWTYNLYVDMKMVVLI